jgi:hypothetical protein
LNTASLLAVSNHTTVVSMPAISEEDAPKTVIKRHVRQILVYATKRAHSRVLQLRGARFNKKDIVEVYIQRNPEIAAGIISSLQCKVPRGVSNRQVARLS